MSNDSEEYPEMDYFMDTTFSDVIFVIEGQTLTAHKSILSLKNKVFRELFSKNIKEEANNEVVIEDTTYEAFKTFIRYLYCDQLILSNEKDLKLIEDIYKLSDKYKVFSLKKIIINCFMDFQLDFDLWEEIYKIALKYEIKELEEKVMSFMEKNIIHFIDKNIIYLNQLTNNRFMEMLANTCSKISSKNMESVIKSARDVSHNYYVEKESNDLVWGRSEPLIQCCLRAIQSAHDYHTIARTIANELNDICEDITCHTFVWEQNFGTSFGIYHPNNEGYIRIRFGRLIIEIFASRV